MNEQIDNGVWRREVPGGWIYTICNAALSAAVFVPFPPPASAVARERARCKALVLEYYDGAPDAGMVPMSEIARIAREIEGGQA